MGDGRSAGVKGEARDVTGRCKRRWVRRVSGGEVKWAICGGRA